MATRSTIALEFADGTVQQVYSHWDGYLAHNGQLLQKHYSDPFVLRELIDLGDVSSLGEIVGEKHAFSRLDTAMDAELYEQLYGKMTTFYGRDRGETGTGAKQFKDYADYIERHQYEEYEYILRRDGVWYVKCHSAAYVPLAEALQREAAEEEALQG
jgi:hypothetical protein